MRTTQAKAKQTAKKTPTKKTSKPRKATTKRKDPYGWAALFKSIEHELTPERILLEERHIHSWKSFVTREENRILWQIWRRVAELNPKVSTFKMTEVMLMKAAAEIMETLPPPKFTQA